MKTTIHTFFMAILIASVSHAQNDLERSDLPNFFGLPYELNFIHEVHKGVIDQERLERRLEMMKLHFGAKVLSNEEVEELRPRVIEGMQTQITRKRVINTPNFYAEFISPDLEGIQWDHMNATDFAHENPYSLEILFFDNRIGYFSSVTRGKDMKVSFSIHPEMTISTVKRIAQLRIPGDAPWIQRLPSPGAIPFLGSDHAHVYSVNNDNLYEAYIALNDEGFLSELLQLGFSNNYVRKRNSWGDYQPIEGFERSLPHFAILEEFNEDGEMLETNIYTYSSIQLRPDLADVTLDEFIADYKDPSYEVVQY